MQHIHRGNASTITEATFTKPPVVSIKVEKPSRVILYSAKKSNQVVKQAKIQQAFNNLISTL